MKQLSEAWFQVRKGRITGSRIGAILGVNPYAKPDDVMRDMVRDFHGAESEFNGNQATQWGNDHEQDAREAYEFLTDLTVTEEGFKSHDKYPFIGVSPDGLTPHGGVEFKCPFSQKIPDEVPAYYYAQVQLCMEVYDVDSWPIFYWTPNDTKLFPIKRDHAWWDNNLGLLEDFHENYLVELDNPKHLEDLVQERTDDDYLDAALAYRNAKESLTGAQDAEKQAREALLALVDRNCRGNGVQVTQYTRQGNVNYKSIPELEGVDLNGYRGKSSTQYRVTVS